MAITFRHNFFAINSLIAFLVCLANSTAESDHGIASHTAPSNLAFPEQVHLSLSNSPDTSMTVTWSTPIALVDPPYVEYGKSRWKWTGMSVTGRSWHFDYQGKRRHYHSATMDNLEPNSTYYYQVGSNRQGWSHLFHFKTFPSGTDFQVKFCIFGDLGHLNGTSLPYIQRMAQRGEFDIAIHVGDISYDLHSEGGNRGDAFLRQIEPIAAHIPYMVVAGNHEEDLANFSNYRNRFLMPNSPYGDNQFYSVNVGPVHMLAISTEYYGFFHVYGMSQIFTQYEWIKNDLKAANKNRVSVPWVLSYQHRPFYCSNINSYECHAFENRLIRIGYGSFPGLEGLLVDEGVDFGFWGHEHSYERFWPVANRRIYNLTANPYHNAAAPIYVLTGSAGCYTEHAAFSAVTNSPASAKRLKDYGYSMLSVINGTHALFEQFSVEGSPGNPVVVDTFWVSKDRGHVPTPNLMPSRPFVPFPDDEPNADGLCLLKPGAKAGARRCKSFDPVDIYAFGPYDLP